MYSMLDDKWYGKKISTRRGGLGIARVADFE